MMTPEELTAKPHGAVVHAIYMDTYWRKGPRDTWHPISPTTGERHTQRDAIRSAYLERLVGRVVDNTAETERLSR